MQNNFTHNHDENLWKYSNIVLFVLFCFCFTIISCCLLFHLHACHVFIFHVFMPFSPYNTNTVLYEYVGLCTCGYNFWMSYYFVDIFNERVSSFILNHPGHCKIVMQYRGSYSSTATHYRCSTWTWIIIVP